ncbi:hypothetical protein [Bacillus thuringiensis]|uniref:hypothetical protein n=1 Tax=Bacillus thuringiensis TaxID=1428 RepID=UPI002FFF0031
MDLNNSKVISSFELNGKKYIILELVEKLESHVSSMNKEKKVTVHSSNSFVPESFGFDWPNPSDFDVKVKQENGKVCIYITYEGNSVWSYCWPFPNGCINPANIDIFTIEQTVFGFKFKITVYLRYISICLNNGHVKFDCEVWAKEESTGGTTRLFPINVII